MDANTGRWNLTFTPVCAYHSHSLRQALAGYSFIVFMKTRIFWVGKVARLLCLLFLPAISVTAQTNFTILKIFTGPPSASVPYGSLIWGTNGALYGTTAAGGVSNVGTVFKINPDGTGFAVLKSFLVSDGATLEAGLALGTNGSLYGTAYSGGTSNFGTVFRLDQNGGNFSVLHYFLGGADGANPSTSLLVASDGFLYGTTYFANSTTRGTVFKIGENGSNYAILHNFTGTPDGQSLLGKLIESTNGLLYGTTVFGGANNRGCVYRLDKNGGTYSAFFSFSSSDSLGDPMAGVLEASDGLLYGSLYHGGSNSLGSVFALAKDLSSYTVLHKFTNTNGDGKWPNCDFVEGTDGTLYSMTDQGGSANSYGTIFKLDKNGGNYTVLRDFARIDGESPKGGLLKGTNGLLYGTTYLTIPGAGSFFVLSTNPLPPRVTSLSVSNGSNVVQFAGTSSIQYDVQRSTNLSSWSPLVTLTAPLNGQTNYTDPTPPHPAAYYRLKQD
jgi:uncharacterized repeat protein (TIGR03803 family)